MADITFKFKRGSSGGSSPSGLTHGELAVNTTDNRLFVGSVTGSVNAVNNRFFTGGSTPSYPIEGDRWYTGTVEKFYYSGNWVTAGGASGSSGSSFDPTQLLVFNSGVSGSGGATFAGGTRFYGGAIVQSGGLSVTGGATITGGVALYGTITVNGAPISSGIANVPLASSSATGVASFGNQFVVSNAGAVGLTSNYVISVNGMTGAVTLTLASSAPLASSSATGVASFGNEFVVSAAGAVGLTSNYVKSFNGSTGTVSFAVPLASSSATGVASFGNEFVVSAAGAVGLTSNYVKSFNGSTGTVSFAVPVASSSITGVASFGNEFVVSAAGAVSLTSNNVISVNGRTGNVVLPVASSSATGVASFTNEFVVSTLGAVSLTSNYVKSFNNLTGAVSFAVPLASSSATGVASFGNEFSVSNLGAVGFTSNYVKSVNGSTGAVVNIATTGSNTFTGLQTLNAGLTTTHLHVTNGATFAGTVSATLNTVAQPNITSVGTLTSLSSSGLVTASGGITSNHLYVTNGVTFASTSVHTGLGTFNAGITSSHLYVTNGATFANGLVVQAGGISITGGATLTGGVAVYGGLNVSSGTISGTLATAAQTNITSVGTLTRLEVGSGGISSAGGITGTLNTAAQPNITSVGTLTSLSSSGLVTASGGITSSHLYVTNGVTFAGTSVHTGLGTFNAGITSSHLYVTSGATFASGLSVTGGTAYFFRDVYLATGANHPGIVDYEYAANMGITYPSASTPAYTVGDKWSNGSIEYTWNGSAWIENTDNIFSSTPIDFNSIVPSQSITRAKLSPSAPFSWDSLYFTPGEMKGLYGDVFELPYGLTAAYYFKSNMLTTKQYVDEAVAGIYNATQTIGPFTVTNAGDNTSLSLPEYFELNRKYYVNWSVNAISSGDRSFDILCQAPSGYGIIIYPFYNNFTAGKGFSIQFPSTSDAQVSIGDGGGTASYASGINNATYRIKQTSGGGGVPTQKGCFIYEIVPLLVL